MRRPLAPYAISAALVLVISLAVLAGALAAGGLLEEQVTAGASPVPSPSHAAVELSRAGRLAYWRTDATAGSQLWVSNLDGSQRRAVARIDGLARVQATRWSPDGNAIAYLDRGEAVVVQHIDGAGARYELGLPAFALSSNARIIDFDWSTDSASLAATVRGSTAGTPNSETDVWAIPATGGQWRNQTDLGTAFLSQWISADEILVHTRAGLIGVQRLDGTGLRPLTAQVATSPFLGDDGRIYYLAGQVAPAIRDATVPVMNAGQARVYSLTLDGGDIRSEMPQLYDDVRLAGQWSPGRYLARQGASTALAFLASGQPPLATVPGVVDRVVFSPDRRTAIGLASSRIVRYDTTQPDNPVVLLSDVTQPDAWYPQTLTIARSSPALSGPRPAARYAFAAGGLVWATDATGQARPLRQLQAGEAELRRLSGVAVPQWSPAGDRVLFFDVLSSSFRGAVSVAELNGSGVRLSDQDAAGPFPTWSPDGTVAYTDFISWFDSAGFAVDGEVRIVPPTSGAPITTYKAREIAFGGGKTYLIDNGKLNLAVQTRTDHAILEVTASGIRTVTLAANVNTGSPFSGLPIGSFASSLQLSMLGASADGEFLSVRLSPASGGAPFTFALLRASDGTPTIRDPGQSISDVRWSPVGHLVGMTNGNIPVVRDADTGAIVASATSGRFAGWSPDGKWFYVARDIGLYAIALSGGEPVRISSFGVPVSTTP